MRWTEFESAAGHSDHLGVQGDLGVAYALGLLKGSIKRTQAGQRRGDWLARFQRLDDGGDVGDLLIVEVTLHLQI